MRIQVGFGAGYEKGTGLVQPMQTGEIDDRMSRRPIERQRRRRTIDI